MSAPFRGAAPALSQDTAVTLYSYFAREAELQDQYALEAAAAWRMLGKVACALVASNAIPKFGDISSSLTQRLERISRELSLLDDAARMGGTLSATTIRWFATALLADFERLREELDGFLSVSTSGARGAP